MQAHPLSPRAAWTTNFLPVSTEVISPSIAEGPGLAHDAGNLLGALGLYCDLLDVPGVLRPEHLHYARELRFLSQRSSALISRLMETGADPCARPTRAARLCPAKVLRNLTPLLRSLVAPESDLVVETPAELPPLPFCAENFERILVNLTRNAATALRRRDANVPGDPVVTIHLELHQPTTSGGPSLVLTIADNAGGMSTSTAAGFLKPAPLPPGSKRGLGHRIVHELLQSTRGNLHIHVVTGRSTTLRIEWPLAGAAPAPAFEGDTAC